MKEEPKPFRVLVDVRVELTVWADSWRQVVAKLDPLEAVNGADKVHTIIFRRIEPGNAPFDKKALAEVGTHQPFMTEGEKEDGQEQG